MIPSRSWFPASLQERAAWFQNFAVQFSPIAASLGFLPAVVTQVASDNDDFQFCASQTVEVEAFAKAFRAYRQTVTEGNVGEPAPAYPLNPSAVPPAQVPTGIFERLDELVKRIRVAPAYTAEIGALLGIVPAQSNNILPEELQPVLKVTTLPGSVVQVKFTRGDTNGIFVETKIDNSETWNSVGVYPTSPAVLVIPQNPQNLPPPSRSAPATSKETTPWDSFRISSPPRPSRACKLLRPAIASERDQ